MARPTNIDTTEILKWISREYHDMNGQHYETMEALPTSLEFSKLAHISRPVLICGTVLYSSDSGFCNLRSPSTNLASPIANVTELWTDDYLAGKSGDRLISIAVTPNGRADAITKGTDGRLYFVEPLTSPMTMKQFLSTLASDGISSSSGPEVHYLQSQNGNLFCSSSSEDSEFGPFLGDIPKDLPWCTEVLGRHSSTFAELRFTMFHKSGAPPDAVNLWIGDGRSVTSIHSDPYENVYCVIRGSKTFTLLPPTEGWCMRERTYPHAKYERTTRGLEIISSGDDVPAIRWSSVLDPTTPGSLPPEAHPMTITVSAGECLYLPAGWWHYVEQNDITIAVNYWYDIEGRGASWVWLNLLRGIGEPPAARNDDEDQNM